MITLEFIGSRDLPSRAISAFTWSWCDHVQFVVDGARLGAMPGKGVQLNEGPKANRRQRYIVPGASPRVLDYALAQIGKPYDWSCIAGIALHRDWRDERAWICSELVAAAFEEGAIPLLRADELNRITPRDLLLSPRLIRVA